MDNLNQCIEAHYHREGLYESIIQRLKQKGTDIENIQRSDIAAVDEFHVRGAAVSKELASYINLNELEVLDIGCGLGGPSRMLAEVYSCQVTGIDLSHEYIRTARQLSALTGSSDKTIFIQANATELPFDDETFDAVWTQHVQMNISNKKKFYSEIHRVLKPGGHLLCYEILKKGDSKIRYPMPWASKADMSFLFTSDEMHGLLDNFDMKEMQSTDHTQAGIAFFETLLAKLDTYGPPILGLNVLMGESTESKLSNLLSHMRAGDLELRSGIYKKGNDSIG